jgi:energy-coupling factor transporter transmembrane protein EcfT
VIILDILELIIETAVGTFIDVGVFVGSILLLFEYVNIKKSGKLVKYIENSKSLQPLIAAVLGLTPGCGGAIFLMPLYLRGTITFGAIVAVLMATMGDSAFVLIAERPMVYVWVTIISFVVAVLSGYLINYFKIGSRFVSLRKEKADKKHLKEYHQKHQHSKHGLIYDSSEFPHLGHNEGDEIDLALHHKSPINPGTLGYKITHSGFALYWIFIFVGLVFGIIALTGIEVSEYPIVVILGVLGVILSILWTYLNKKVVINHSHEEMEHKLFSIKETFIHTASETAFVITWVFIALLAYNLSILLLGSGDYGLGETKIEAVMLGVGILSIVIGSLIGIIPGCGPQIIFVSLFARGMIPFSALVANAISQDGDALFPLLVMNRKSAFWASFINTIAGLAVGLILYYFGF